MIIRKATILDVDSIYDIYLDKDPTKENKNCQYPKSDWKWYIENNGLIYVSKEENGELSGFIFGYDMGLWGYIEHIVVSKKYRGNNIGQEIIKFFIKESEKWDRVELCHESGLEGYFEKFGFEDNEIVTKWLHKLF